MEMRDILAYFALKHDGMQDKVLADIDNKVRVDESEIDTMLENIKYPYVTIIDDDYPEMLKHVNRPPIVMFYRGDINLINENSEMIAKESRDGVRMIHAFDTNITNTGIEMNCVMACECHDDMDMLLDKMNEAHSILNELAKIKKSRDTKSFQR